MYGEFPGIVHLPQRNTHKIRVDWALAHCASNTIYSVLNGNRMPVFVVRFFDRGVRPYTTLYPFSRDMLKNTERSLENLFF